MRTRVAASGIDLGEEVDERAVAEHDDAVAERLARRRRRIDRARGLPARTAVGRARHHARPAARVREAVPHRVNVVAVGRVRGQRILVVEEVRAVADQRRRCAPCQATIGRADDEHRVVARLTGIARERQGHRVDRAIRRDVDPRVGGALIVAAVGRRATAATRHRLQHASPGLTAVERGRRDHRTRAAIGPTVLLPGGDEVARVGGIGYDERLDLGIDEEAAGRAAAGTPCGDRRRRADSTCRQRKRCRRGRRRQ